MILVHCPLLELLTYDTFLPTPIRKILFFPGEPADVLHTNKNEAGSNSACFLEPYLQPYLQPYLHRIRYLQIKYIRSS